MKRIIFPVTTAAVMTMALCLTACENLQTADKTPAPAPAPAKPVTPVAPPVVETPVVAAPTPAQVALKEGNDHYDKGEFYQAIKKLTSSPEIWEADNTVQLPALKTMAFSYCVTGRKVLCRQQFEKALKLDPTFDLEPGEKNHPLWGPVFAQAKRNALKKPAPAASKSK